MRELRLAREQVIDQATVALTGARRAYLETLLYLADRHDGGSALSLSFFRARQLRRRVAALITETSMSRTQLVCVSAVVAVTGVMTVTTAQRAFPMPAVAWLQGAPPAQSTDQAGPLEKVATVAPQTPHRRRAPNTLRPSWTPRRPVSAPSTSSSGWSSTPGAESLKPGS